MNLRQVVGLLYKHGHVYYFASNRCCLTKNIRKSCTILATVPARLKETELYIDLFMTEIIVPVANLMWHANFTLQLVK